MKRILRHLVFVISIFYSNIALSNETIYYIDLDFIMNNSLAGKSIIDQLNRHNKTNIDKFKKTEDNLKSQDSQIISQKNVLSNTEYKKKIDSLKEKISKYKIDRNNKIQKVNDQKIKAQSLLVEHVTLILNDYSLENSISIILPKKSIIIAKTELDITTEILNLLDKKVKKINLKK